MASPAASDALTTYVLAILQTPRVPIASSIHEIICPEP